MFIVFNTSFGEAYAAAVQTNKTRNIAEFILNVLRRKIYILSKIIAYLISYDHDQNSIEYSINLLKVAMYDR